MTFALLPRLSFLPLWPRRVLRGLLGLLLALVLLLLAAWAALPYWLEHQGVRLASEQLGRPVSLDGASFKPWRLALELRGLRIGGAQAKDAPLLELRRLEASLSPRSVWHLAPVLASLQVEAPVLRLAYLGEGRTDLDDILKRLAARPAKPAADEDGQDLALYNIELSDGELQFTDQTAGMMHRLDQLNLGLPFLSTLDADVAVHVQPRLSGRLNGVAFQSEAQAQPFAQTRSALLKLKLEPLDLAAYRAYWPQDLPLRLAQGQLGADLQLDFRQPAGQAPALKVSGDLALHQLRLEQRLDGTADWQPWLGWQRLTLGLADVQPLKRQLVFSRVALEQPQLALRRDARGQLILPLPAGSGPAAGSTAPAASAPSATAVAASAKKADKAPPAWAIAIQQLEVDGGELDWLDQQPRPAARLRLDQLGLKASGLAWPLPARAAAVSLQARLGPMPAASSSAQLSAEGQLSQAGIQLDWSLQDLALTWLSPYLQAASPLHWQGQLGTRGQVQAGPQGENLRLSLRDLAVDGLQALEGRRVVMGLKQLQLDQAELALDQRLGKAGRLSMQAPQLQLQRDVGGRWNWARWLSAAAAEAGGEASAPQPWSVQLAEFQLQAGQASLLDQASHLLDDEMPRPIGLQDLQLRLRDLAWNGQSLAKPVPVNLSLQLRRPDSARRGTREAAGRLQWDGTLALAPLRASGKLQGERLPLHWADPYLDPALGLHLQRAEASVRGDFNLADSPKGPAFKATADVLVADLRLRQARLQDGHRRSAEELLNWQALNLTGLQLQQAAGGAPAIHIRQAALDDFYARLIINEQGRLNLRDLRQTEAGQPVAPTPGATAGNTASTANATTTTSATTVATPQGTTTVAPAPTPATPPLAISIAETRVKNGRVDFNDRFIKPNYSADISELTGSLGSFSAGQGAMAPLQLRGKVAGTGQLEVQGQLNPAAAPLALDITASANDIELAPLSPYAGKYAGFAIERGKLSTKVHYRIDPAGLLEADNQIVLKQLNFGERIDSPEATGLPVRLAVALLKDSNGVIDLNLPVRGSINDPEFSIGGVVFKLIINLLTKALTSPFSLLTGGGGPELSELAFLPGTTTLDDNAPQRLDQIAKALADRPALELSITGWVDPAAERRAAQAVRLDEALLAERRRELRRQQLGAAAPAPAASAPAIPAAPITLDETQRARLLKTVYEAAKLPDKPRNFLGLLKDIPAAQMRDLLMDSYAISDDQLRELALQRSVTVRDALIARGVPNARLFLASPKLHAGSGAGTDAGEGGKPWQPRVDLSLGAP